MLVGQDIPLKDNFVSMENNIIDLVLEAIILAKSLQGTFESGIPQSHLWLLLELLSLTIEVTVV